VAVYDRRYRRYQGALTPERSRFLVLPRYAYREVLGKRLFLAFFVTCYLVPLGCALLIYLPHNASFLQLFVQELGAGSTFTFTFDSDRFLRFFLLPQSLFSFFLAFLVGPALISADLRDNALPLYLARPLSRWEYVLGKACVLVGLLSAITWIPGLLLFALQGYLVGDGWLFGNLRIGLALLLASCIGIAVLTLVSLAISAYVKWKPLARLGLFLVFVVAAGLGQTLNLALRTHWGSLLNVLDMMRVAWGGLFGSTIGISETPLAAAWLSLLSVCALCVLLLARKVHAYEVVR
jgi:ABC-2 type transport system permease protein